MIRRLKSKEINRAAEIIFDAKLRGAEGAYPSTDWLKKFTDKTKAYAFGYFKNNILIGVLFAEPILDGGVLIWYIAILEEERNSGYGTKLVKQLETVMEHEGKTWIFLNGTKNSLDFYKKHGFECNKSEVFEHLKDPI